MEANLFTPALDGLLREQRLAFHLDFHDIIPGSNADGQQYAKLLVAIKRLMQAINDKNLRQEKGCSLYLQLFPILSLDGNADLIRGKFNPDLKAYLLDLGDKFTTADLESLLMRRQ